MITTPFTSVSSENDTVALSTPNASTTDTNSSTLAGTTTSNIVGDCKYCLQHCESSAPLIGENSPFHSTKKRKMDEVTLCIRLRKYSFVTRGTGKTSLILLSTI